MVNRKFVWAAACVVAVVSYVGTANAANIIKSGDTVEGWKISFPAGVQLVSDTGGLVLEKFASFTNNEGFVLTFTQVDSNANEFIKFVNEALTNSTGTTWTGFQHILNTEMGNPPNAEFTDNFSTTGTPFSTVNFTSDVITFGGGTVANTDTINFGFGAEGGDMVIDGHPTTDGVKRVFTLKEVPVVGVPLPAAIWSGLSGLAGIGVIGLGKKARRLFA